MRTFKQYFILTILVYSGMCGCKKDTNTPTANPTPELTATINSSNIVYTGSVALNSYTYIITGVTATNSKIQIKVTTSATGSFTLNGGLNQAICTSPTGEVWQTTASDTGSIVITTLNTSTLAIGGTFSFTANETSPTFNASALTVINGYFYLIW